MELTTFLAVCLVIAAALVLHHQRALKKAKDIVAECVKRADELSESYQRTIHSLRKDNSNLTRQVKELQAELTRAKENERSWIPRDMPEPPAPILHTPGSGYATRPAQPRTDRHTTYSSSVGGGGSNVDIVTPAAVAMAFSAITSEPACDTSSSSSSSYDSGSSCSSSDSGSGGW